MGLLAGRLRHRVTLERQVALGPQDPNTGEIPVGWRAYARVPAEMAPASAREFTAAAATQSEVRGKATLRYRPDTDASHSIVFRGKRYAILGVLTDNESGLEWMTLPLSEGVVVVPE